MNDVIDLSEKRTAKYKQPKEEHAARHAVLHVMLDELVANYLTCTGRRMGNSTILELVQWSHAQTLDPTEHE